jgi:hypothetical protein
MRPFAGWVVLGLVLFTLVGRAEDSEKSKKIDFENEVIEGENKKPLDSLTELADSAKRRKSALYEKRQGFQTEDRELLRYFLEVK